MSEHLGISIDTLYRNLVTATPPAFGYGGRKGESWRAWQRRLRGKLLELLAIVGKPRPAPFLPVLIDRPMQSSSVRVQDPSCGRSCAHRMLNGEDKAATRLQGPIDATDQAGIVGNIVQRE